MFCQSWCRVLNPLMAALPYSIIWTISSLRLRLGDLSRGAVQLELFAKQADQRQARLDSAIDALRTRFGPAVLQRCELRSAAPAGPQAPRVSQLAACRSSMVI